MQLRRAKPELIDPRGAVRGQLEQALKSLSGRKSLSDKSIHELRRELKRARAGLRLLRNAVGDRAYARENAALRDAARTFAPVRDAAVVVAALDRLLRKKKLDEFRPALRKLRGVLQEERVRVKRELRNAKGPEEAARAIEQAQARIAQWRVPRDVWPVVRAGLERVYRRGRKALAQAQTRPTDIALHESRKQMKYLDAALAFLEPAEARRAAKLTKKTDAAAEELGEDHDLAVLRSKISQIVPNRELTATIERKRRKLQKKALKKASRLYRRKPNAFVVRLETSPAAR
jgi:CHAD domain-containing protein